MAASDRVHVFISYRHREPNLSWVQHVLVPALARENFTVVLDVADFSGGDNLMDAMDDASDRALVTLAVISDGYGESGMTTFERQLAHRLVAVLRDPDEPVPAAEAVVDLTSTDEPSAVLAELHRLLKRVFVLHADEDAAWVEGVLLAMLDDAGVIHEHAGAFPPGSVWTDEVVAAMERADRVIVVLSAAYLRDTHGRADTLVSHWEAEHHDRKLLPIAVQHDLQLPRTFQVRLLVEASQASLWDAALRQVCKEIGIAAPESSEPPSCPYPGLRSYDEERAEVFFGREDEISEVLTHLRNEHFVAIIGPSGSGKSSLAISGVAHVVKKRGIGDVQRCQVAVIRPGADPLAALGEGLESLGRQDAEAPDAPGSALLVVDQLEEVFTVGALHADEFLARIDELLRTDPAVNVLVTMRADFYPRAMECALWPRIAASRCEVLPPRGDRLREAIRAPALARGVIVDEALVERLAAETEGQPGLLPFLQEALVALWDRMTWRLLSLSAYEDMAGDDPSESGVLQAIRRQADATIRALEAESPGSEQVARAIFLRLIQFGEGRAHTRRRQPLSALRSAARDDETFQFVFDRLVGQRLITPDRGPDGEPVADLAHEAIIAGWPMLRQWVDEDATAERARRHLLERAQEWDERVQSGTPQVGLLEDVELTEAERWTSEQQTAGSFTEPLVRRYVDASRARVARRRRRRRTAIVGGFVTLAMVASVLAIATVTARRAQRDAERETVRRTALQLDASAAALPPDRLSLRALLVRAADEIEPSPLSRVEMLTTAERTPAIVERRESTRRNVGLDALWADADRVVVGDSRGELHVWHPDDGRISTHELARVPRASQPLLAIARQPDTDRYAVGGGKWSAERGEFVGHNGGVDLLDLSRQPPRLRPLALPGSSVVSALAFADSRLVVGRWDGTVALVDLSQPEARVMWTVQIPALPPQQACSISDSDRKVRAIAYEPRERLLAVGSNNCLISVWALPPGLSDPGPPRLLTGHDSKVRALAFAGETTRLLSTGDDRSVRAWDVSGADVTALATTPAMDELRTIAMCVSPDGQWVITAGRDHSVRRSRLMPDGSLAPDGQQYEGHGDTIRSVACLSPTRFLSLGADALVGWDANHHARTARAIDLNGRRDEPSGEPLSDGVVHAVAASPRSGRGPNVAVATSDASGGNWLVLLARDGRAIGDPIDLHGLWPHAVAFSADGGTIGVAGELGGPGYGMVATVDVHSREREAVTLPLWADAKLPPFFAVAMLDDQHYIAGGSRGTLIEMSGDEPPSPRPSSGFDIRSLAYSPDGRLLMAGDSAGVLACYRVDNRGSPRGKVDLARSVDGLAVAPDGTVAAGTADNDVFVFRAALHDSHARDACLPSNWPRSELRAHTQPVSSVTFGLNGKLLASASYDGTLALWDLDRSRLLGRLEVVATPGSPGFAAIDGGGRVAVAATGDTAVRFPLEREELRRRLCELGGRSLTRDERTVFLPDQRYTGVGKCGTS